MRKLITLSALVATVALGWLILPGSAAPALADKPVRWEYSELHYAPKFIEGGGSGIIGNPAQPGRVIPETVRWITAEEEIEGKSWDELAAKLKAPAAHKDAKETTHKLRVFNQLGTDGWELVGPEKQQSGKLSFRTSVSIWAFKRRVP
jgi:hypothetical protein